MSLKSKNIIIGTLFASLAGFLFSVQLSWASTISQENVVDLVNYSRFKEGLNVLVENSKLNQAALEKAQDMIQHNYFAHTSPQDVSPWHWFEKNRYDYKYAGENLAINFENAEEEHEAWMESEDHKKNILNPKYHEIGVAVERGVIDGRMATITVQMFGAREDSAVVLGQAKYKGSLELLNRELESGPWGQLAFVKSPAKQAVAGETAQGLDSSPAESFRFDTQYWIAFFEGLAVLLLLASVAANPLLLGWMAVRKRKAVSPGAVYPIRLAVTK